MNNDDVIDIKDLQLKTYRFLKNLQKGGGVIGGIIILIWLASGIYLVGPDEVGVVRRFGAFVRTTQPGPHYHLPYPIENVLRPKVTKIHRIEVGFRTTDPGPPPRYRTVPKEALMLTGDENIVAVEFIVQYKISDPIDYLFNVRYPIDTIKAAAEASIREVIGRNLIDEVLTVGKAKMQEDTMILLQSILDGYKSGIHVVGVQLQDVSPPEAVISAFKDVASAREDKEKLINQAQGYRNDILPKAKGEAAVMINQSKAYTESRIKRAEGEANRFLRTLEEYAKAPDIIRTRIYIETMEEILPKTDLIIMEGRSSQNILPYLPLRGNKVEQ